MGATDLVIFVLVCAADAAVLWLLRRRRRARLARERMAGLVRGAALTAARGT